MLLALFHAFSPRQAVTKLASTVFRNAAISHELIFPLNDALIIGAVYFKSEHVTYDANYSSQR